jgi:hypothetical protein
VSFPQPEPPSTSGRRLTRLLGRWANARRLDARQAAALRQRVLAASVDLGFDWWWRLLDPDGGSVFRASATRIAFDGEPGLAVEPSPLATGIPGLATWPSAEPEYQPYLRLT